MRLSRRVAVAVAAAFFALTAARRRRPQHSYRVENVRTQAQRSAVARTGAAIVEVDHGSVTVTASRSDLRALRRAGLQGRRAAPATPTSRPPTPATTTTPR